MIFIRSVHYMNTLSAEWFINKFNFIPENGSALTLALNKGNIEFITWHLSKWAMRDKFEMMFIEGVCRRTGMINQYAILEIAVKYGLLQHYRITALEIAVARIDDKLTEFILRECTFTDAEIESINELPQKFRPLGPKCAILS